MKIDLHNHLKTRSTFKESDFDKLIDYAHRKLGERGLVGITNMAGENAFNYEKIIGFGGYERIDLGNSVYVPEKDIILIKTQEVPTKEGHLLAVGIKKEKNITPFRSLEDSVKEAKDLGALLIVDHPFGMFGIGEELKKRKELIYNFDGIEIHNGETSRRANKMAQDFYDKIINDFPHLSAVVSSDGHSFFEIGSSYTEIPEIDLKLNKSLIEQLRKNLKHKIGDRRHNSYLGRFNHGTKLGAIILLMKMGLYKKPEGQTTWKN